MGRDDPDLGSPLAMPRLFCDLTQSWSDVGGGVRTYLLHKRRHILDNTPHRHLLIIPGERDEVVEEGRAITVTIKSPHVPLSPHYRLLLRNSAVQAALDRFRPDLIECQDAYNLPWAAVAHRKRHPETALVAAYMTDFPTVYVERPVSKFLGKVVGGAAARLCYRYCGALYRRFDTVFALSENGGGTKLRALGVGNVEVVGLGVELGEFGPTRRDERLRHSLGLTESQPLLIYVGRLDIEKRPDVVVDAFRKLPAELGARLVLLGEGPLREEISQLADSRISMPGYVKSRTDLSRWLASADIYVSAMADETFGVSIVEAQASGLPVVGVASGAMIDRVGEHVGLLGPVGDSDAMAGNILKIWRSDRRQLSEAAMAEAKQYSWARSMESLFGTVYPTALSGRVGHKAAPSAFSSFLRPAAELPPA
ncbi:glycosyltransferase family 1 protein [Sphingomonas piscis]|uniref:Glycosyltransferase family 1 protein n=1 Tax=Sphingomonas piscis TaxID=2714943 RepID=A0A6G7YMY9_9SPHN|nr:glycosyltransferase [Sphingomonas piscis]QIK78104.1 glycosyltransferase family 1 protein [Sphingomonas piscis]